MDRRNLKSILVRIVIGVTLIAETATTVTGAPPLQRERSKLFYLFRLDGTFSEELSAGTVSDHSTYFPGFQLTAARLEDDSLAR